MNLKQATVGMRVIMNKAGREMWDVPEYTRSGTIISIGRLYLHIKRVGRKTTSFHPAFWKIDFSPRRVSFDDLLCAILAVPRKLSQPKETQS